MRFLELHLAAVGHFTDVTLPLDTPHPAFHLIFGRNEAGKSTTLRAIRYLLYGFPERTSDGFLHSKLRVGARIALDERETLEVVRRKGRKRTLLDPDEQALDESCLIRALHGVGEEQFVSMFGLDHEALRRGGESLLDGKGNVGESLFDAGTGGRGIHQILRRLESDADALFRPRGRRTDLNEAIDRFREASLRIRSAGIDPAAARAQRAALDAQTARKSELDGRDRAMRAELDATRRDLKALPPLRERQRLRLELDAAGPVPMLSAKDVQSREALQRELERATMASRQHGEELARLETRLAAMEAPQPLAEVAAEVIRDIETRRGGLLKALSDLPHRQSELKTFERDTERELRALNRNVSERIGDTSDLDALRLPKEMSARIAALAQERGALFAKREETESALEEIRLDHERLEGELQTHPPSPSTEELRTALDAADALGNVEQQRIALRTKAEVHANRSIERGRALGLVGTDMDASDLRRLPVPSAETIERHRQDLQENLTRQHRAKQRLEGGQAMREEAEAKLATLSRGGSVPSEAALERARGDRNRAWGVIRRSLDRSGGQPEETAPAGTVPAKRKTRSRKATRQATLGIERPEPELFDELLRRSDELADRLRREAGRVAQHAELTTAILRAEQVIDSAQQDLARERRAADKLDTDWRELWQWLDGEPLPPEEMRSWLSRFEQWRETSEEAEAAEIALRELESLAGERTARIGAALAGFEGDGLCISQDLASMRERARTVLKRHEAAAAERKRIEQALAEIRVRENKEAKRLQRRSEAIAQWTGEWASTIAPLGLAEDARPEEAQAVLEQLDSILQHADRANAVRRRIDGMKRDEMQFAARVEPLVSEYAVDLQGRALEEQADALVQRYRHAVSQRSRREELTEAVQARRDQLSNAVDSANAVRSALDERMKAAGVETLTDLSQVEERARQVELVRTELNAIESHLRALMDGEDLDRVAQRLDRTEARDLRIREEDLQREIEAVDQEREALRESIVRLDHDIDEQQGQTQATEAAADAELALSKVRTLAHRFVRLRLAASVVRREVDRYRERNQGPVLSRAGELFPRLTNRRYRGLKVGFGEGDEEVLQCIREDGAVVPVEHLSDGSQDQLYLALRLASLERFQSVHGSLPLILDDVFLHFDEDRAKTALSVLGEYSRHGQVLFFTHQARLRELAEQAVHPDQLDVHNLDSLRTHAGSAPSA